jgi:hypothetical protein
MEGKEEMEEMEGRKEGWRRWNEGRKKGRKEE